MTSPGCEYYLEGYDWSRSTKAWGWKNHFLTSGAVTSELSKRFCHKSSCCMLARSLIWNVFGKLVSVNIVRTASFSSKLCARTWSTAEGWGSASGCPELLHQRLSCQLHICVVHHQSHIVHLPQQKHPFLFIDHSQSVFYFVPHSQAGSTTSLRTLGDMQTKPNAHAQCTVNPMYPFQTGQHITLQ